MSTKEKIVLKGWFTSHGKNLLTIFNTVALAEAGNIGDNIL